MPRIEIWKSKNLWNDLSPEEKRKLIEAWREVLNVSGQNDPTAEEPYLISKDGIDLLIWTSSFGLKDAMRFLTSDLPRYFELLSYMSPTRGMDAKKIARKLNR